MSNNEPGDKLHQKSSFDDSQKKRKGIQRIGKYLDFNTDIIIAVEDVVLAVSKKSKASKLEPVDAPKIKALEKATLVPDIITLKDGNGVFQKKAKPSKDAPTSPKKPVVIPSPNTKSLKSKRQRITQTEIAEKPSVSHADELVSDEEEIDDQTEAILEGLESDDDNNSQGQGYEASQGVPKIDTVLREKAKAIENASVSDNPGVLYVGRIPHGFYEHQMKQYFSQFGDIQRIRLSRNRKTGRSKHFAFLEFKSAEVADIVAKTMDNYLLFGHILKCKIVPLEQVHEDLFKGANKRFKKVPWNKLEGRKLAKGMTREGWDKRVKNEELRRHKREKVLERMGYSFEAPKLKSAKDILHKDDEFLPAEINQ